MRHAWLNALVDDIVRCRVRGQEVIVVSSGAIAVGRRHLGLSGRALRLEEKQAAAATGQIRLAHAYQEALGRHGITDAQILLTPDDPEARQRHLNAAAHFRAASRRARRGAGGQRERPRSPPRKSASATMTGWPRGCAQISQRRRTWCCCPTSTLGSTPPIRATNRARPTSRLIREIGPEVEGIARAPRRRATAPAAWSPSSAAARIAMSAGCHMIIAKGAARRPLAAIEAGVRASLFLPLAEPRSARKAWIAGDRSARRGWSSTTARPARLRRGARACCRRARRGDRGRLRARRLRRHPHPRRNRGRAGAFRLCQRRHPPHRRAQER